LQLHKVNKVKVAVSFIFKKRTVRTNELQTQSVVKSVTTVFFDFDWLVATTAASQQHKKFSSWQQVLRYKYQYQYQY